MEKDNSRALGINLIALSIFLAAISNYYLSIWGESQFHWSWHLFFGTFNLIIFVYFYALNKTAYYIVVILNGFLLIVSVLAIVSALMRMIYVTSEIMNITAALPTFIYTFLVGWYLKKKEIKAYFTNRVINETKQEA